MRVVKNTIYLYCHSIHLHLLIAGLGIHLCWRCVCRFSFNDFFFHDKDFLTRKIRSRRDFSSGWLRFIPWQSIKGRFESNCGMALLLIGTMSAGWLDGRWNTLAPLSFFLPADPLDGLLFKEESKVFWNESWNKRPKERKEGIAHRGLLLELSWLYTWTFTRECSDAWNRFSLSRLLFSRPYSRQAYLAESFRFNTTNDDLYFHLSCHFVDVRMPAINNDCISESVTLWDIVFLQQLILSLLARKSPALYGTRRFITALTSSPLVAIMSQIDPVQALPPCIFMIYCSVFLPSKTSSSG